MSLLLDVDLLVACAWQSHERHQEASRWLGELAEFYTCPPCEMGFLRVSMSPSYRVGFDEARAALSDICDLPTHRFLVDATTAASLPAALFSAARRKASAQSRQPPRNQRCAFGYACFAAWTQTRHAR
jgi:predicted nucleic acid-binding protein